MSKPSFYAQAAKSRSSLINVKWKRTTNTNDGFTGTVKNMVGRDDVNGIVANTRTWGFNDLASRAYKNERGYAIRTNPRTGEREMFVAGTRKNKDWLANAGGSLYSATVGRSKPARFVSRKVGFEKLAYGHRIRYAKHLDMVADREGVDVVYGHSRGHALVNDMRNKRVTKVGLDGADLLSLKKGQYNIRQKQWFDAAIAGRSKSTRTYGKRMSAISRRKKYGGKWYSPGSYVNKKFHYVYRYKGMPSVT